MIRLLIALCLTILPAGAQTVSHVTARPSTLRAEPGGHGILRVELQMDAGWHIYAPALPSEKGLLGLVPFTAASQQPELLRIEGDLACSPPRIVHDAGFQRDRRILEDRAWVDIPCRLPATLPAGACQGTLLLGFQACTEENCLPPARLPISFQVEVPRGPAPGLQAARAASGAHPGAWSFLWLAALAGGAALLTPCVFPLVPVTLAFFTHRSEQARGKVLLGTLAFALGIVCTFTALGLGLALLFGATGIQAFATHWAVNLGLAVLFVGFAMNLFGQLNLRMPGRWTSGLGGLTSTSGTLSAGLMGLTFTLTSFTCTVPFVGSALVAASRGAWFQPAMGMLVFSAVFATPFLLLASFPSLLPRLPNSGAWMGKLKAVLGMVEMAAALKFVSNADLAMGWGLLSRERFLMIWVLCALGMTLVLLLPLGTLRWGRALAALGALGLGVHFALGAAGRPLGGWDAFLPPSEVAGPHWHTDLDRALAEAKRTGRPLFLDFTGVTCTNCRWMEAQMFPRPAVAKGLDGFVKVRLSTDRPEPGDQANQRLQQTRFQTVALPLYAILGPDGSVRSKASFTRDEQAFLAFLAAGTSRPAGEWSLPGSAAGKASVRSSMHSAWP